MVSHLNRSHIINVQLAMYSLKVDNDLNFSVSLSEDLNGILLLCSTLRAFSKWSENINPMVKQKTIIMYNQIIICIL